MKDSKNYNFALITGLIQITKIKYAPMYLIYAESVTHLICKTTHYEVCLIVLKHTCSFKYILHILCAIQLVP